MQTVKSQTNPEPYVLQKHIGSTTYIVNICINAGNNNKIETLEDKLLRLIESGVRESA